MERFGSHVTREEIIERDRAGLIPRKLHRAALKDTVTVPDGGYTAVRFHANNPGMCGETSDVGSNLCADEFYSCLRKVPPPALSTTITVTSVTKC